MTEDKMLSTAQTTAERWGALTEPPKLLKRGKGVEFELRFASGPPGILRFHPAEGRDAAAIRSMLLLMESLADTGFACPWPLRTTDATFIYVTDAGLVASVTQLLDADPLTDAPDMEALGALIADLHLTADTVAPEELDLPQLDLRELVNPALYRELSATDEEMRKQIETALNSAADQLNTLTAMTPGIIHGAVLPENLLRQDHQLYLTNFDQCGVGHRAMDLATSMLPYAESGDWATQEAVLCQGYRDAGGSLSDEAQAQLPLLAMLIAIKHLANSAPRVGKGAVQQLVAHFLNQTGTA
ncbi:MAG: phosphotransferase [Pseudomonadota bacterium]